MPVYAFTSIAVIILAITIFRAIKKRHNMSSLVSCIMVGIFFATFFMVLPTEWVKDGTDVENPVLYSVLSSLLYSFKTLGGRQEIKQIESIGLSGTLKTIYVCINYLMFVLAPVITSTLILSFIGDTGERIRYFFYFAPECCVFSEINVNSVALAKERKNHGLKKALVFCNAKNADKNLLAEVRKLGGISLYQPCNRIRLYRRFKEYEFFIVSENQDDNIAVTEEFIVKKDQLVKFNITLNSFVESHVHIDVMESMTENTQNAPLKIRFIDKVSRFCSALLFKNPLYDTPDNSKDISVLIVGGGRFGMQMLKTVVSDGQINGYSLKITVIDKNASVIEKELYSQCPELEYYDIRFKEADINDNRFSETVNACADATCVFVTTGSDDLNISTAEKIYIIFRRRYANYIPKIFSRVRQEKNAINLEKKGTYLSERNIRLFGTTSSVFVEDALFNSELENLAFAVHLYYCNALGEEKNSPKYKEALFSFRASEYSRNSSAATALHIPSKLKSCGITVESGSLIGQADVLGAEFEKKIKDDKVLTALADNEHERWNAYMRSAGYQRANFDTVMKYAKITKSHKDAKARLHPCIVSGDELRDLQKEYDEHYKELGLKPVNFEQIDIELIKNVSAILKKAAELSKEKIDYV